VSWLQEVACCESCLLGTSFVRVLLSGVEKICQSLLVKSLFLINVSNAFS
jgi:hypothetical protein